MPDESPVPHQRIVPDESPVPHQRIVPDEPPATPTSRGPAPASDTTSGVSGPALTPADAPSGFGPPPTPADDPGEFRPPPPPADAPGGYGPPRTRVDAPGGYDSAPTGGYDSAPTGGSASANGYDPASTWPSALTDGYDPASAPGNHGAPPTPGGLFDNHGAAPASGGTPHSYRPAAVPSDPYGLDPVTPDPFGLSSPVGRGPRIEPSPPPRRNRLILGLIAGFLAGLLLFGIGGYVLGRATAPGPGPVRPPTPPVPSPSLGVYEQSQVALNRARLSGPFAPLAEGWLPYLSACDRSGDPGGPELNKGEKVRVRCRFDGMSVIFVEYATVADRDKARVRALSQNVDARTLTPGVAVAGERPAPSGRTSGSYVEYAYAVTQGSGARTVGGIWWDDARVPVAAYMLAYWTDGVGGSWAPMREIWARYA